VLVTSSIGVRTIMQILEILFKASSSRELVR
jgi:hypothetical protein